MRVRDEGAWREVNNARAYVEGAWREIDEVQAYEGDDWRVAAEFVDPLSVTVSPVQAAAFTLGAGYALTQLITAIPTGGRGPFLYQWSFVSGIQGIITSPATPTTAFSLFLSEGASASAVYRCTITDNLGSVATANVPAFFQSDDIN